MIRLFQWLIIGHAHRWVTDELVGLEGLHDNGYGLVGRVAYQHCDKCGTVRRKKLA